MNTVYLNKYIVPRLVLNISRIFIYCLIVFITKQVYFFNKNSSR